MPGYGNKLYQQHSFYEVDQMKELSKTVIYNFLNNIIPEEKKLELLKKVSVFEIISLTPGGFDSVNRSYNNKLDALNELYDGKIEYTNVDTNNSEEVPPAYKNLQVAADKKGSLYYTHDAYEAPFNVMLDGMKEIAGYLDTYVKSATDPDDKKLAELFLYFMEDFTKGRGFQDKIARNPAYGYLFPFVMTSLNTNQPMLVPEVKNGELTLTKALDDENKSIKTVSDNLKGTRIRKMIDDIFDCLKAQDDFEANGEVAREDLIKAYEKVAASSAAWIAMPEEEFNAINATGALNVDYGLMFAGTRGPYTVMDDAEARVRLLKAGWPESDISVISGLYQFMKNCERQAEKEHDQHIASRLRRTAADLYITWEMCEKDVPITQEKRNNILRRLVSHVNAFDHAQTYRDHDFISTDLGTKENLEGFLSEVMERQEAELSPMDKVCLASNYAEVVQALNEVDPKMVKSSPAFSEMKTALVNLSQVDPNNEQARYETLKQEAIRKTRAYISYKHNQLHDPRKPHKRSELEASRVTLANEILNRLQKRYEYKERVLTADAESAFDRMQTPEDKYYYLVQMSTAFHVPGMAQDIGLTSQEIDQLGMPKNGMITEYQTNLLQHMKEKMKEELKSSVTENGGNLHDPKDMKRIFDMMGSVNAKVLYEIGKGHDAVRDSLLPEEDPTFLEIKTRYLIGKTQVIPSTRYNEFQGMNLEMTQYAQELGFNKCIMDTVKQAFLNDKNVNQLLDELGVERKEQRDDLCRLLGVHELDSFRDAMKQKYIDPAASMSESSQLQKVAENMNQFPKYVYEAWINQATGRAAMRMSREDRQLYKVGKTVSSDANIRTAEKLVADAKEAGNNRYEEWVNQEMPAIVAERKKQSLSTGYPEAMEKVKHPAVERDIAPYITEPETELLVKGLGYLKKGQDSILQDLKSMRTGYMNLQNDKTHFGTEGGEHYRNMANALNDCIQTMENKDSKPSEIRSAMEELIEAADIYRWDSKQSAFGDYSEERYQLTMDNIKLLHKDISFYDALRLEVTNDRLGTRNMSYNDVKDTILNEQRASKSKPDVPDEVTAGGHCMDTYQRIDVQEKLLKNLSKLTSHELQTGLMVSDPDDYVPSRNKPTAEKLAADYMITSYIVKMKKPGTSEFEVNQMNTKTTDGRLQREITALSQDKVFQAVALANPDTYYSKWNEVCREATYIQRDCDLAVRKYEAKHVGYENRTMEQNGLDIFIEVKQGADPNPVYKSVAEHIKNQILADPRCEKICRAIAAGQIDQKDITKDIVSKMKEKKLLANGKGIRYKSLKNGELKDEYIAAVTRSLRPRKLNTVRRPARAHTGRAM